MAHRVKSGDINPAKSKSVLGVTWSPNQDESRPSSEEAPKAKVVKLKPIKQKSRIARMSKNTKEHDVEWLEAQAAEQLDKDLVKYMKEAWKVEVSQASSLLEVSYRTMELMEKTKPADYWLTRRGRELYAEHTGLFSDVRRPYQTLGDIDLDTDMLVFNNLPPQLKIDPGPWFRMKKMKEDEERRKNAPLPRLPRTRMVRPSYARGRINVGAGGTLAMDKFVRTAEEFQKGIRGSVTFVQLLSNWREQKEDEAANRGSEFGVMKRAQIVSTSAPAVVPELDPVGSTRDVPKPNEISVKRKSSIVDDRVYQMQMLNFEKMMQAMYDILKSLLNMKQYQVKGSIRLPASVVTSLRDHSPETKVRNKKRPPTEIMRRAKFAASIYTSFPSAYGSRANSVSDVPSVAQIQRTSLQSPTDDLAHNADYEGTGRLIPNIFDEEAIADIIPVTPGTSPEGVTHAVKRVHDVVYSSTYLDDRPAMLKSQTLKREAPEMTIQRIIKNEKRYRNVFEPSYSDPEPIWHDVRVEDLDLSSHTTVQFAASRKRSFTPVDYTKERDTSTLPYTLKNPHIDDIPTPTLPGFRSRERLDSAEQSRLNLLAKVNGPGFDRPPPSAIQRLYDEAGVKNREPELYRILMKMKTPFRNVEKKIRFFYTNEIEKYEWDTMKRYRTKIGAITPDPIFEWSIGLMRQAMREPTDDDLLDNGEKRPSMWYRNLIERCELVGALKHMGCEHMLMRLHKYCDVDMKSRPMMLNRFCLLVISLPPTELGTSYFQDAIAFLLDRLFGSPKELLYQWLNFRGLPLLI